MGDLNATVIALAEAATVLRLAPEVVIGLVEGGYLASAATGPGALRFRVADLKAFVARNSGTEDNRLGLPRSLGQLQRVDPRNLLDALDGRAAEMARRVFDIFSTVFPEARGWDISEQARFVEQAQARFEAILAVTGQGAEVDEALVGDLQEVGAQAAWSSSPLPQLLVILRISRDLVVQTAVELAEEQGPHWGLALSLLLTRILPAMDRLTDALAQGYWSAVLSREEGIRARYQDVVERSSDGVYETDLAGRINYANTSLAVILGRTLEELHRAQLREVIVPLDSTVVVDSLLFVPEGGHRRLTAARADGVRRVLDVQVMPRSVDGELVGFQGIVRDATAARDLEADKNEFLAMVTHDVRNPLTTIVGLGATLESHATELAGDQIERMGEAIRRQAERIARLADDLYDVSRLEAQALLLSPRAIRLRPVVDAAVAMVANASVVRVEVPEDVVVLADPRRLEQVVANLIDNAVEHGAPPVVVGIEPTIAVEPSVDPSRADEPDGPTPSVAPVPTLPPLPPAAGPGVAAPGVAVPSTPTGLAVPSTPTGVAVPSTPTGVAAPSTPTGMAAPSTPVGPAGPLVGADRVTASTAGTRSASEDSIVLTVSDNGAGVPEALVPTLFSGLRLLGSPIRDRSRGTGLGLAMVRALAEAMGGRVWYQPGHHGGAVFCLAIPVPRTSGARRGARA